MAANATDIGMAASIGREEQGKLIGFRGRLQGGQSTRAMTLFELAVVMTIAIVLVGLAVFSTGSLVMRTKVSKVQEEHRVVARALQNYQLDYADFPGVRQGLASLVRPTAYLASLPDDPFQDNGGTYLYLQPQLHDTGAFLISPGPDGDFDLPPELWAFTNHQDIAADLIPAPVMASLSMKEDGRLGPLAGGYLPGVPQAGEGNQSSSPPVLMNATERAILSTYLRLGAYHPDKGNDGDIITSLR